MLTLFFDTRILPKQWPLHY